MMDKIRVSYWLALTGYFGLLALLLLWLGWLSPPTTIPISLALFLMLVPLLFPLRGLLYGRPYTFAWTSMLALFYFTHGIVEAYSSPTERSYALLEIALSGALYLGCIFYARLRGKQLKTVSAKDSAQKE